MSASAKYCQTKHKASNNCQLLMLPSTFENIHVRTNFNLNSKTTKLCTSSPSSVTASNAEEISYKCCICDKVFGCSQTLQVSAIISFRKYVLNLLGRCIFQKSWELFTLVGPRLFILYFGRIIYLVINI